jgi:signal transduction histidine kinase
VPDRAAALCRLVFNFRLLAVSFTLLWVPRWEGDLYVVLGFLAASGLAAFAAARFWRPVSSALSRHPALLGVDLVVTMAILTVLGPQSPFFYVTLGTALLAGVLYGWTGAAVFSGLLLLTYWVGLVLRSGATEVDTYQALVGTPLLYPLAAAAGAAVRRLLDRQVETEAALAAAGRATAVERERARLAREMHDSLAKTLHGLALSAAALPGWVERDPSRATAEAGVLEAAARRAAGEARGLIGDLRADSPDSPLGRAVSEYVEVWSRKSGVDAEVENGDVPEPPADVRWELFCILREALVNVEQHARARRVTVTLDPTDAGLRLQVADDGKGLAVPDDLRTLSAGGHFGLVGMRERAERGGGSLVIDSSPGRGVRIVATVPVGRAKTGGPV